MKNNHFAYMVLGVLLIVGVLAVNYYKSSKTEDLMMKKDAESMVGDKQDVQNQNMIKEEGSQMMKETSRYVEYSKDNLDKSAQGRRVLFFFANWCPTCIPADKNFKDNAKLLPEDVTLIRVNYEDDETDMEEKALAKKYAITYQHTFVQIDSNGHEVAKWNGGKINELLANIK